jgi:hypothetical protein
MPHFDAVDICNEDRAAMVAPLLWAFAAAYDPGDMPHMREEQHLLGYVVSDFIGDLMHWCDQNHVIVDDMSPDTVLGKADFYELLAEGQFHHDEEVADELSLGE